MAQKFTIILTLTEDPSDRTAPEINMKSDASGVSDVHFGIIAKTMQELTLASLEAHLQVSSDLAEAAIRAVECGAFEEE